MKASELIERLKEMIEKHGDLEVSTEGCDCYGDSAEVIYESYEVGKKKEKVEYFLVQRSHA